MKVFVRIKGIVKEVEVREPTNAEKEVMIRWAAEQWLQDYAMFCRPRVTKETVEAVLSAAIAEFNIRDHEKDSFK